VDSHRNMANVPRQEPDGTNDEISLLQRRLHGVNAALNIAKQNLEKQQQEILKRDERIDFIQQQVAKYAATIEMLHQDHNATISRETALKTELTAQRDKHSRDLLEKDSLSTERWKSLRAEVSLQRDQHSKRMKDLEVEYRLKLEKQSKLAKILFGKARDKVGREYQQKLLDEDLLYRQKMEELVLAQKPDAKIRNKSMGR
jgi:hypothetical protein